MLVRRWVEERYARRLRRELAGARLPAHVAIVMDGNRRWARQMGMGNPSLGHRHGAEHLERVLDWCAEAGVRQVSTFVCSLDNLHKRPPEQVDFLMRLAEQVIAERLTRPANQWRVHVAGRLDMLPGSTARALKQAVEDTRDRRGYDLTLAIGYDGRGEIVHAVQELMRGEAAAGASPEQLAARLTATDIAAHLSPHGLPDPDLVIRTSGERRLNGFLLWQSAQSELYFCDVYWPGFRRIDFLRALRTYAARALAT